MSYVSARSLWRYSVVLGLLTSTLLMGCGPEGPTGNGGAGGDGGAGGSGGVGGGAPGSSPCDGTRWIGIKPPQVSCGSYASANWAAEGLFEKVPLSPQPATLARYCLFTWNGPAAQGPSSADVQGLLADTVTVEGLAQDCHVVWPQTNLPHPQIALEHRRWIHEAAGGLASLPPMTASGGTVRPMRLAIVDNAPDATWPDLPLISASSESPRPGDHGTVLAYLGLDLGCPAGPGDPASGVACAVHPQTVLAMSGGSADPMSTGGLHGTKGEVATGIARAVADWKQDLLDDSNSEARLVVNLSLGWEDHSNDPSSEDPNNCHVAEPSALSAPARSVHDAIALARCHGAAVLAAAGNHTGGNPPHEGLMCPAHFMLWDAPSDEACVEGDSPLLDPEFVVEYNDRTKLILRPETKPEDPLVTAVGAVDHGDQVLAPHRPNSLPPLVGPGLFAASYEGYFTPVDLDSTLPANAPTTLSGTSVGTLVASAVTAATWAYEPEVSAAVVTGHVYALGAELWQIQPTGAIAPMVAEQHPSGSPPPVMRASLCRTLKGIGVLAADTECSDHHPFAPTGEPGEVSLQNPAWSQSTWAAWNDHFNYDPNGTAPLLEIESPSDEWTSTPLHMFYTAAAGLDVIPLPVYPTCTVCGIFQPPGPDAILYLDLTPANNSNFDNPTSSASMLFLVKVHEGQVVSYDVGAPQLGATVRRLSGVTFAPDDRLFLQWKDPGSEDPETSAFTPLAILP